jgi:hypothetical protein
MSRRDRIIDAVIWAAIAFIAMLGVCAVVLSLSGCAVGRELDGDAPMVGLRLDGSGVDVASTLGGTIGGLLFGPPGAAVGAGVLGTIAAFLGGTRRGERRGWDENESERRERERLALLAGRGAGVAGAGGGGGSRVGEAVTNG